MIFALALVLLAMPQEADSQVKQQPTPEEVQQWWDGLSEQEQQEYKDRQKRFRQLEPTMQEELGRRHDLLREERKRVKENLTEEEKVQFNALRGPERRQFLDVRAHENLRQRGEKLEGQMPGADAVRQQPELERRHQQAAKLFEQQRGPQVREAIREAVEEGWIGEVAGKWLETAPLEEAMSALMEVRKWQFLQKATEQGLWQEMGFDEQRRRETIALPAPEFFRAIRGHREGRPGRGGSGRQFGPPGEHRGGMRGNGREGNGRGGSGRGPGEGRGSGPGPGDGLEPGVGPGPGDGLGPRPGDRSGPGPDGKPGFGPGPDGKPGFGPDPGGNSDPDGRKGRRGRNSRGPGKSGSGSRPEPGSGPGQRSEGLPESGAILPDAPSDG